MKTRTVSQAIQLALLGGLLVVALGACSVIEKVADRPPVEPAPQATAKPAPKQLGSLWSESSSWNYLYTAGAARVVGDIITIRLDPTFKKKVKRAVLGEEADEEEATQAAPTPTAATPDKPAEPSTTPQTQIPDSVYIRGTIAEVGPRGVYRITAGETLRIGTLEPYVQVKGRVRDRDIDTNDEIKVADIVDLSMQVLHSEPDATGEVHDVTW